MQRRNETTALGIAIESSSTIEIWISAERTWKYATENGKWTYAEFSLAYRKEVRAEVKYRVIYRYKDKYSINYITKVRQSQ